MIRRLGLIFCIAIAAALPQDHPQQTSSPAIRANVREVLVPVVVTDKAGHYVTGLGRDDFSVSEDGVLQKIIAFSRSSVTDAGVQPDRTAANPTKAAPNTGPSDPPKRTYLICLDILHSAFEDFTQVRSALKKFFAEEEAGESQYALVVLGRELHIVVDSTRDPETVLKAIDSKALLKTILDSEARNIATETDRFARLVNEWCGACPCANQYMDQTAPKCVGLKAQVKSKALSFPERAAILNRNFLQQLSEVVHAMTSMPTRRTVIFFSDGFNRFAGQEFYDILRAFGVNDGSLKFSPRDLQPELDSILKLAARWDIRFYTIDSRGLYTHSMVPGSGQDASSRGASPTATQAAMMTAWSNGDAMAQLARQTGGQFFENSNNLLKGIRTAFADGREEYVLAYVPANTNMDGQFRKISVELKDRKLHVAAKAGYWSTP